MKIRTDFVTNSSSSSFTLTIRISLTDRNYVSFSGTAYPDEPEYGEFFKGSAYVHTSPKQLGAAESVDELISLLQGGVIDDLFYKKRKIFTNRSRFVKDIRQEISSIDKVEKITIRASRESGSAEQIMNYTFNRKTNEYTGKIKGRDFYTDGERGGELLFSDISSAKASIILTADSNGEGKIDKEYFNDYEDSRIPYNISDVWIPKEIIDISPDTFSEYNVNDIAFHVVQGSYGEKYVTENGYKFDYAPQPNLYGFIYD